MFAVVFLVVESFVVIVAAFVVESFHGLFSSEEVAPECIADRYGEKY